MLDCRWRRSRRRRRSGGLKAEEEEEEEGQIKHGERERRDRRWRRRKKWSCWVGQGRAVTTERRLAMRKAKNDGNQFFFNL